MKLIWTKHGINRGYLRIGKDYSMDLIEKKIKKNIHRATLNPKGSEALVPFNLGGQWYVSILIPRGKAGLSCVIKTMYPISDQKYRHLWKKSPNSKNL
jgi:hypothetical protein